MPLLGQASGAWTESSSALRILHVGVRNTTGVLTADSFTQTNPPIVSTAGTISTKVDTTALGCIGGSIAFSRPDVGSNYVGGPKELGTVNKEFHRPLGVFINAANGNMAFDNQPAKAGGVGPYVSAQGTYGNALYETYSLEDGVTNFTAGTAIPYAAGQLLMASRNGYLMPTKAIDSGGALRDLRTAEHSLEVKNALAAADVTILGVLKMPADSTQNELVYDQRI